MSLIRLNGESGSYNSYQPSKTARVWGSKAQWTKRMVGSFKSHGKTPFSVLHAWPILSVERRRCSDIYLGLARTSSCDLRNRSTKHESSIFVNIIPDSSKQLLPLSHRDSSSLTPLYLKIATSQLAIKMKDKIAIILLSTLAQRAVLAGSTSTRLGRDINAGDERSRPIIWERRRRFKVASRLQFRMV
jgi:hypothetical protein